LILIGLAVERLGGKPLDQLVYERVCTPLGLQSVHYSPVPCDGVAPTKAVYTPELLCGQVHDDNARGLGGVAGHAGLFADVHDLATFGEMYRRGGAPLLRPLTVAEMTREQAVDGAVRRGIGFALWSPDPEASSNPFSERTYGHTGFTGTSLWIDPARALVVALLTNRVYYGSPNAQAIAAFRVALGREICHAAA
jgi:CubicO group peptidase (beta-lactamase class C family)